MTKLGQLNGIIGVQLNRILRLDYFSYVASELIGQARATPSWRQLWIRSAEHDMSLPSPVHITVAIALQANWDSESHVRRRMEKLGLDLTSNVVPHDPHMYFNPAGVEKYFRELRHHD